MVDTTNKGFELPAYNSYVNTWDVPVNANANEIDSAFGGSALLNSTGLSGDTTLAVTEYRPLSILVSGTPTATITYVVPSGVGGQWVFKNGTSGGFTVGIKSAAGGSTITVAAGYQTLVSCDGTSTGMRLSISTPPTPAGSTTQIQFNSAGALGGSSSLTWNGTTLTTTGMNVVGNTEMGATSGSTITIVGTDVSIPNNLNIDSNTFFINSTTNLVGIGTTSLTEKFTVAGTIKSTSGGFVFPDGSTQTTAAGAGGASGSTSWVQYNSAGAFSSSSTFTFSGGVLTAPSFSGSGASITGLSTSNISGLGTMATQNASGVSITGGSLASVSISGSSTFTGTISNTAMSGIYFTSTLLACTFSTNMTCQGIPFANQTSWTLISDARLKKDVEFVPGLEALNRIMSLTPREFRWIKDERRDRGFIAQEFQTVYPQDIRTTDEGNLAIAINMDFHADIVAALRYIALAIPEIRARRRMGGAS